MNKVRLFSLIIIGTLFLSFSFASYSMDTKMYLEDKPIDFILTREDFYYDKWISIYMEKRDILKIGNSLMESEVIIGNKQEDYIEYNPLTDLRKISFNLNEINQIRERGNIVGMFLERGKIFVVVERSEVNFIKFPEDILVIIRGIYDSEDYCIWQTIDPPSNRADWERYGMVYYGGNVENTHVGMVMFESDRIMKCLSSGYDNRTGEKIDYLKAYNTEWDFMRLEENDFEELEEWHRYWFTTKDTIVEYDPITKAVKLEGQPLSIKTERMEMIGGKLESTFNPDYDSSSYKWTRHFEINLNYYASYFSVLYEIQELSRWTALFTAIYETGFTFKEIIFKDKQFPYVLTPIKTPVISVVKEFTERYEKESYIETLTRQTILTGGVGLEEVTLKKADLSGFKNEWLKKYNEGSALIVCISE